jgi:SAM-dependent methyltransferase
MGNSEDVRALYEQYPFPKKNKESAPDFMFASVWDAHFTPDSLAGKRVLEAGCGSGHKLAAFAKKFPKASFVGIDLSEASLDVARDLLRRFDITNVELRRANLLELDVVGEFDVVSSMGVVHHMEDPQRGLDNLARAIKPDGALFIWLYHPYGDFERLRRREMLLALWGDDRSDLQLGESLMKALDLHLDPRHYGGYSGKTYDELEADADAFMHPIVNAYTFDEAMAMLRHAGCTWGAIDYLNFQYLVKFLNLANVAPAAGAGQQLVQAALAAAFELRSSAVVPESVHERFLKLDRRAQLRIVELAMRPRGFQIVAGKSGGEKMFGPRLLGNLVQL